MPQATACLGGEGSELKQLRVTTARPPTRRETTFALSGSGKRECTGLRQKEAGSPLSEPSPGTPPPPVRPGLTKTSNERFRRYLGAGCWSTTPTDLTSKAPGCALRQHKTICCACAGNVMVSVDPGAPPSRLRQCAIQSLPAGQTLQLQSNVRRSCRMPALRACAHNLGHSLFEQVCVRAYVDLHPAKKSRLQVPVIASPRASQPTHFSFMRAWTLYRDDLRLAPGWAPNWMLLFCSIAPARLH